MTPRRVTIRPVPLLAVATIALLLAACGDSDGDTTPVPTFEGLDGASLFQQACSECHGADLTGSDQGPPLLHDFYVPGHHADIAFFFAIRRGTRAHHWNFGDMPPIEGLADDQAEAIVAFVRERQRAAGIQ